MGLDTYAELCQYTNMPDLRESGPRRSLRVNGQAVRTFREMAGFSQSQFAQAIGIYQGYLARIENGDRNPSAPVAKKIADGLKIPMAAILAEVA